MRVIICGGRSYAGDVSGALASRGPTRIVHGACPTGADALADAWARANGVPVERYPADWKRYGRAAGPIRNQEMVDAGADLLIAFPGGRGTRDMILRAKAARIPVLLTGCCGTPMICDATCALSFMSEKEPSRPPRDATREQT